MKYVCNVTAEMRNENSCKRRLKEAYTLFYISLGSDFTDSFIFFILNQTWCSILFTGGWLLIC